MKSCEILMKYVAKIHKKFQTKKLKRRIFSVVFVCLLNRSFNTVSDHFG